jgi:hypothetical protein
MAGHGKCRSSRPQRYRSVCVIAGRSDRASPRRMPVETVSHRTMPATVPRALFQLQFSVPCRLARTEAKMRVRWESRYSWRCHVSLSMPRSRQTRRAAGWSSARAWSVTPRSKLYDLLVFAKREWTLLMPCKLSTISLAARRLATSLSSRSPTACQLPNKSSREDLHRSFKSWCKPSAME